MKNADTLARAIAGECVGYRVRMLNRLTTRIYDDELRPLGIKFSQLNILTVVTLRGPVQPAEVARVLALEKSTLSRNVRILEDNGWIEVVPGEAGNTHLLRMTAAGRRMFERAAPAWRAAQERMEALLGPAATRSLVRAADRAQKKSG